MKGCFVCKREGRLLYTFGGGRFEAVCSRLEMGPAIIDQDNYPEYRDYLRQVEVIFCTWDMIPFTRQEIVDFFPNLRLVCYAAGSVQYFARPFLELGIRVVSAWQAMARPVAEFTVAMITLANKGALSAMRRYQTGSFNDGNQLTRSVYPGTYQTRIGILGAGAIGSQVIRMLKDYRVDLMVYDPFVSAENLKTLGLARTYPLPEIFAGCQTISNHIANNPQTVGMLDYDLFSRMSESAAFINTGRGAQVVECDLIRALQEQPLRSAYLDVTWPEPVAADSALKTLPNVFLTPHVAGFAAQEVHELADTVICQFDHFRNGEPLDGVVTLPMLQHMA